MCKLTSSDGLNNWCGYFCMWNFFIRGYFKLKWMGFDEFISLSSAIGFGFEVLLRGFKKLMGRYYVLFCKPTLSSCWCYWNF